MKWRVAGNWWRVPPARYVALAGRGKVKLTGDQLLLPWYVRYNPLWRWVTIEEELRRFPRNEDLFWAMEAPKFDPTFRVASAEDALPFAFEMSPRWCYEQNGNKLPFRLPCLGKV